MSNGAKFVFCSSDRPTVIYSRSDSLIYSNVNLHHVSCVSTFNTPMTAHGLAIATDGDLKIGAVEAVQKLHVKSIHIGETVRRIAYNETSELFGIITTKQDVLANGEIQDVSSFKILHGKTFECITLLI